jgi:dipeptidyl aminopeptidase/acylaminoacyl peptidase
MSMRILVMLLLCLMMFGCQSGEATPAPPPTLIDLNAIATESAATAFAIASPTRRPLPPTWTPSPEPTLAPTEIGELPTVTPEGFSAAGTIYYIFNGDAIVRLLGDGSFEELIPIPHIGMGISDLTLSPDGQFLAYVGPGNGSAREIYITDRQGVNTRQVSQLGFARIIQPAWRPDSSALAFLASQAPDMPLDIYIVSVDGSGQRPLTQGRSQETRDLAWNQSGDSLFFSDGTVYGLDLATGTVSIPLSVPTGFGPETALTHSPNNAELYYFKPFRNFDTGLNENTLTHINTQSTAEAPEEIPGVKLLANRLRFSADGEYLLISGDNGIWVQNQGFNTAIEVLNDGKVPPLPALSPNNEQIAYVNTDDAGIQQVYTVSRQGGQPLQITFHQEGTITDLAWVEG